MNCMKRKDVWESQARMGLMITVDNGLLTLREATVVGSVLSTDGLKSALARIRRGRFTGHDTECHRFHRRLEDLTVTYCPLGSYYNTIPMYNDDQWDYVEQGILHFTVDAKYLNDHEAVRERATALLYGLLTLLDLTIAGGCVRLIWSTSGGCMNIVRARSTEGFNCGRYRYYDKWEKYPGFRPGRKRGGVFGGRTREHVNSLFKCLHDSLQDSLPSHIVHEQTGVFYNKARVTGDNVVVTYHRREPRSYPHTLSVTFDKRDQN